MRRSSWTLLGTSVLGALSSCATQKTNPESVVVLPRSAFIETCRFLVHVDSDGPIDLSSPTSTRAMKARAAAAGGNLVVVASDGPGVAGGDVYACRTVPAPLWVTQEGKTPAFVRDQASIRRSCQVLVRDRAGFPSTPDALRADAAKIGANAVILESSGPQGERTNFFRCESLPSSSAEFRR